MRKKYYFSVEQLSVGYGQEPLIRDIEVSLPKGEILCLIGPNGAGKSTVLKSIAGQLRPMGGTVYLGGDDLLSMKQPQRARKISVVFTEKLRTELMSCEDVVATGRYPYTGHFGILSEEDHKIVEEAMQLVHVHEIRHQDFSAISDGQKQRVMLARALCQEPEILLLDEPTSYLDVKYKLEFLSVLQEMSRKKQLTVIMSLHELELAQRVADKILCLKGEYVERYGTPEEIFEPSYIADIFEIQTGSFDEENSCMELEAPKGEPKLFVLAGGGCGRNLYRTLQRKNIPFVTGIIYENDLDYPSAKVLAGQVVTAKAFEPMDEDCFLQAREFMDRCEKVICCRTAFGSCEEANQRLYEYSVDCGKLIGEEELEDYRGGRC